MDKKITSIIEKLSDVLQKFNDNNLNTIPFCAAEPIVSDFVKKPLNSSLSDRYIKSGISEFDPSKEFIGSEFLYPIYQLISKVCLELYQAKYADARPLSGMNAALTSLMSITNPEEKVLLLHPDAGAHESFPKICERLSLKVTYIPFDYENIEYDIFSLNKLLESGDYSAIIIPPSDLISEPPLDKMHIPNETIVIYDCTQSFGLIASGIHLNPLKTDKKVILLGGTHKTISGPTCGLVLSNNHSVFEEIEKTITPIYVRNPHPHHVASLLLSLIEFMDSGNIFMKQIVYNANILGGLLKEKGFNVKETMINEELNFSNTHQLFISLSNKESRQIERIARLLNISMDRKSKRIYGEAGIRLGVQAVTRLGWDKDKLENFAELFLGMRNNDDIYKLSAIADSMRGKSNIQYSLGVNEHEFLNI